MSDVLELRAVSFTVIFQPLKTTVTDPDMLESAVKMVSHKLGIVSMYDTLNKMFGGTVQKCLTILS